MSTGMKMPELSLPKPVASWRERPAPDAESSGEPRDPVRHLDEAPPCLSAPSLCTVLQQRPQLASSSFSASSSTLMSDGLVPGPPAKCPHSVSITCSLALGMCLTSNSLSAGGK